MKIVTLPIAWCRVTCRADENQNQDFDAGQFDAADEYMNAKRAELPDFAFELIAVVAA